jgi:transposase, IS30 family
MGRFSKVEVAELWRRWQDGQTLTQISHGLSGYPMRVYLELCWRGGFAPPVRRRSSQQLRLAEREEISRGLAGERSVRQIARQLGRAPSTVSREVRRHGGRGLDRAGEAEERAWGWARRPKLCKLARSAPLRAAVAGKLCSKWSPEQLSGWLKRRYPDRQGPPPARGAAPLAHLGSRPRAGTPPEIQSRDRHERVLLRPTQSLAARQQREHQRPTAPVLPQGHRPVAAFTTSPRYGGQANESAAEEDAGV